MAELETVLAWLSEHEAALSAVVSMLALMGLCYGVLRFVFSKGKEAAGRGALDFTEKRFSSNAEPEPTKTAPEPLALEDIRQVTSITDDHVSLAVMLFQALSKNEDDEFIASGIASEIIALVTPIPDIRVSSRLSSFSWRSGETDFAEVAEQIDASFALTGSLRRSGDRIRVIAQLTDIRSDAEIWSQTFDRELKDLFEVQHEIAEFIVGAILGEVKLAKSLLANRIPPHQLDAWGLAQKAYHFWLTNFSVERMLQACDYLRDAIRLDPDYAHARAALAMLLAQQMTSRVCQDYDAVATEAQEMIEQAYRAAPNDIDVLENAGVTWQNLGQGERAIKAFRHGLELAPLNLITRGYLAMTLSFTHGRAGGEEALQLLEENFSIAPMHPARAYWHYFQAVTYQCLGNHERAAELAQESLLGQPGWAHNYFIIANTLCLKGDKDGALAQMEACSTVNPFLTPELYRQNVLRIVGNESDCEPFLGGLVQAGLILE